ncbi:MAG: putative ABC transport system permease protein, partial [Marinomonas primoryensis]
MTTDALSYAPSHSSLLGRLRLCLHLFARHYWHAPLQASAILLGIMLAV